jgi:secreted trypsin-like serine protease
MRHRRNISVVTALACLALAAPAAAITNGGPDGEGHPNVAAIIVALPPEFGGGNIEFCTGSLLTPTLLLTAGHCTDGFDQFGIPDEDISVTFDSDTRLSTAENAPAHSIAVTGHETHPAFRYGGLSTAYNDVGLLHLATPVTDRAPVTLPPANWLAITAARNGLKDKQFLTVGYGLTGTNHRSLLNPNNIPTFDDLRRVSWAPFSTLTPYQLGLQTNTSATGGGGACSGDSGGPTFPNWAGAPTWQVAVTTSGDPVCRSLSRRQRLDTPIVLDWLHTVMAAG